jgi:Periplasmic binding protein
MAMEKAPKRPGLARYWPVAAVVVVAAGALGVRAAVGGDHGGDDGGGRAASYSPGDDPPALAAFPDDDPLDAPDCDPETGKLAIPTEYAPVCVPVWDDGRDNGGETYPGVTEDEIVVAYYDPQQSETAEAITQDVRGGEDAPTEEEDDANRELVLEAYQNLYETYGRTVRLEIIEASGANDDDAAARADAIKAADDIGAFAVIGGPGGTNAFAEELAARGVLCLCTASQPIENYQQWAPYVWGGLMASTQAYVHRSDYITERLAGQPAEYAGDPAMHDRERTFAVVYYETADGAYESGVDFFEDRLAEGGVDLVERIPYVLDLSRAQEDAATVVARLKDADVTSVIFAGDPYFPIYLTEEATAQDYRPEWVITGSTGTDASAIARRYDQEQWAHAFGISLLTARVHPDAADETNLVSWYHGRDLASYPQIYDFGRLFLGIHLAGPELTPETFRDGLFSWDGTRGYATVFGSSYGGDLWPWEDYLASDDVTEIWWDPDAEGPDEADQEGRGLYRYVDEGRRYMPGEIGDATGVPFEEEGTVTLFPEVPEGDRPPRYERRTSRTD